MRDLETAPPSITAGVAARSVPGNAWIAWQRIACRGRLERVDVRDGAKGPLVVDIVKRRVVARTPRRQQGERRCWW